MINELWAKKILNDDVTWDDVPLIRRKAVKAIVDAKVGTSKEVE